MKPYILSLLFILIGVSQSIAHVNLLNPLGGEIYEPGNVISIEWQEIQSHETLNWDILFSHDGGNTWDTINSNIPINTIQYSWVLPDTPTTKGQIKIVQDNVGMDYEDISQNFVISSITAINTQAESNKINLYPNPLTDFATIEYDNPEHGPFTLTLFDTKGKIVRTITDITTNKIQIETKDLASEFYIYQLNTNTEKKFNGRLIIR